MKVLLHRAWYYVRYGICQWWRWRKWNKYFALQRELFPNERLGLLFEENKITLYLKEK